MTQGETDRPASPALAWYETAWVAIPFGVAALMGWPKAHFGWSFSVPVGGSALITWGTLATWLNIWVFFVKAGRGPLGYLWTGLISAAAAAWYGLLIGVSARVWAPAFPAALAIGYLIYIAVAIAFFRRYGRGLRDETPQGGTGRPAS